ncbi:FAFL052Cp [Eremothecium gossypii FDAG1]|nr:FAFL052Cp [Eremothecium gossypii FDAG1]
MTRAELKEPQSMDHALLHRKRARVHDDGQDGRVMDEEDEDEDVAHEAEEDGDDDEEGETRCVCGELDPPDASGFFIQCESCSVWQHGYCVGIMEGESTPDKYWCEQCRPEQHAVYTNDLGKRRSNYKPTQQRRRQSRRAKRGDRSADSASDADRQRRRYDDELRPRSRDSGQYDDDARGPNSSAGSEQDERRLLNRKRATLSAREEKQYQLMLEKAIRESRRTSQPEEVLKAEHKDLSDRELSGEDTSPTTATSSTSMGTLPPVTTKQEQGKGSSSEASRVLGSGPPVSSGSAGAMRKRTRGKSATSNSSSEEDGGRKRSRRGGTRKSAGSSMQRVPPGSNSSVGGNNASTNGQEVGIGKPIKPRLPTQKTSISEMRRRIYAILEYLSRTQSQLTDGELGKEQLIQFVENDDFICKINTIFQDYSKSLKLMDSLTRKLLLWEQKYASEGPAT